MSYIRRLSYDTVARDMRAALGGYLTLDQFLSLLVRRVIETSCDNVRGCLHCCALKIRPALIPGRYDRLADAPAELLGGLSFDDFIERAASALSCEARAGCLHCAGQALLALKRIVEHPRDCPDCRRIEERRGS